MRSPIILALLLCWSTIQAQQLFDIGFKGGINRDDLRTSFSHEPILGGHAGLFLRVKPPILPGAQAEVLVSTIGTNVRAEGYEIDLRTATLQVPLFLVFALGPVELHGGGYYERFLAERFTTDLDIDVNGSAVRVSDLADNGVGLLGGAGLRLGHFYLGARYLYGLDDVGTGPVLGGVRSRQIQAYVGLGLFKP